MPPITSQRTVLHSPPAPLRPVPVPVPIPGAPVPPLSSSASTFASTPPSAGTSPGTSLGSAMARTLSHGASSYGHSHSHSHSHSSHTGSLGHTPYMVALAGWPEPLFVAERELWDVRKRSRPTTPTGFRGEGPESAGSSTASTPPRHDVPGPLSGPLARLALGDHRERGPNPSVAARTVRRHIDKLGGGGFSDPRYQANAAVVGRGRSLRVAPAWASSTPAQPYTDRTPSGHVRGWPAYSRAVPEVWPPPGVIAQVYPRDPHTLFYARAGSSGDEDEPAPKAPRTVVTEAKRERETSASTPEEKDKEVKEEEKVMDLDR
ncbi:hypothetical protein CspeluHIS016_0405300 [Cutaneotrichosporon spelunceum]|uniref:Uncharacterized protein n=1 Tax=Cutaneotrichosporon spelunceum TaxID=1672016 RepID=A0AAD3YC51_9TREE|nr:hypothetical protein CspeluHIS016_0405300 [Cutaneotrichosporon spelunceum]